MAGSYGLKTESAWGTAAVVDQHIPVLSSNLAVDEGYMRPAGIRSGRLTHVPSQLGVLGASGSVELELPTLNLATLLFHCFGNVVTTAGPLHTYTPGAQVGESFTGQSVITDAGDVARPFTSFGTKIDMFRLGVAVGEYAKLGFDWTAKDVALHRSVADGVTNSTTLVTSATAAFTAGDVGKPISGTGIPAGATIASVSSATNAILSAAATATATGVTFTIGVAAAAVSYPALTLFTFVHGSVSVNGTQVASARAAQLTLNKGLKKDRHVLGSRQMREQLSVDKWEITSEITCDFENNTLLGLARAATQVAAVYTLSDGTNSLVITTSGQVLGDPPSLTTTGLEEQKIRLDHSHSTADASTITAVLTNSDVSAA
jgi:hypothetical protein